MDLASKLTEDLERDEGFRANPYRCTAGFLTIGYGRNIETNGISKAEASLLLTNDVMDVFEDLDRSMPWWGQMPFPAQRALANMAFNLGLPKLRMFRNMLMALEAGDYETAAAEAMDSRWARQVGQRAERIRDLYLAASGETNG